MEKSARERRGFLRTIDWFTSSIIGIGAIFMVLGSWMPWIKVEIKTRVFGHPIALEAYAFSGLYGLGKLTLVLAIVALAVLVFDLITRKWGKIIGLVYILLSAMVGLPLTLEVVHIYSLLRREVVFGIRLMDLLGFVGRFADWRLIPQCGFYLTLTGIVLLFIGGLVWTVRSF